MSFNDGRRGVLKSVLYLLCIVGLMAVSAADAEEAIIDQKQKLVITHADAAVVIVKYSGFFQENLPEDATLDGCVSFLNKIGVYFGMMEVVNGTEFTMQDCARVLGQLHLIFSGDAEYLSGKVILPKAIDSWEKFCIMNYINYSQGYEAIKSALYEVSRFSR